MPHASRPLRCSLHDWEGLRSQLVFTYEGEISNGSSDGAYVRHSELSAWLMRKGTACLEADGARAEVRAGQWLICTGRHIRQQLSPDTSILSIRVHHDWPNGSSLLSGGPLCLFDAAPHPELEAIALELIRAVGKVDWGHWDRSYVFLWKTRMDYSAYMRQQGHLHLWLCALARVLVAEGWSLNIPAGVDSRLAQALFVIDNQDLDKPFPLAEMLAASGLSARQLNLICERAYGLTTHAYWEKRRVERARQALEQGNFAVKEVASTLGFSQLSHFSAWFKRHTGQSPRGYRHNASPQAAV
jgi:AraC-like DNA-binding protein